MGLVTAIAAGAAAVGGIASASAQKKSAKRAARVSQQNNDANNALAREQFGAISARTQPFYDSGVAANNQLNALARGDQTAFDAFRNSTNYQDRLTSGMNSLNSLYAGRGLLDSGAARKASIQFGQREAGNSLGEYMGLLTNQQNAGLSANATLAGANTNMVNAITNNNNVNATNQGNAILARGNANANMFAGLGNAIGIGAGLSSSYGGFNNPLLTGGTWADPRTPPMRGRPTQYGGWI